MKANGIRVAVLGGGVTGLTCAHELVLRGFSVSLLERRKILGGKSRSYTKHLTGVDGEKLDVAGAGEHGFRFFPGFYEHIDDTTKRIPVNDDGAAGAGHTVFDSLVPIATEVLAVPGKPIIEVPASAPLNVSTLRTIFHLPKQLADIGLTNDDLAAFSDKLWQIATSCPERRNGQYEAIPWRDFIKSKDRSDEYYWYLASGLTRGLVAARARHASTKTMGNIALRLWTSLSRASKTTDRVLAGPTNSVWLDPWVAHIKQLAKRNGATFEIASHSVVEGFHVEGGKVASVVVRGDTVSADYFVSALPLEAIAGLIAANPLLQKAGGDQFEKLLRLAAPVSGYLRTMSGLQIYLKKDVPLNRGHQLFLNSPWGLTSLSQAQFWKPHLLRDALPSGATGILSVDISSWDIEGMLEPKRTAAQLLASKSGGLGIFREVVLQISSALGDELAKSLFGDKNANVLGWHLDKGMASSEQLLVNDVGTWELRPEAKTAIANFFFAGDFARTETDLACMEGANESARRTVNAIIADVKSKRPSTAVAELRDCALFAAPQSTLFAPFQRMDASRYHQSLPWSGFGIGQWLLLGADAGATADEVLFAKPVRESELVGQDGVKVDAASAGENSTPRLSRAFWDNDAAPSAPVEAITPAEVNRRLSPEYATAGRADPMFKRWTPYILTEDPPKRLIPFHSYDAEGVILYGKANNLDWLKSQTSGTGWHPVKARCEGSDIGFAELWIINYHDTTTGPYKEFVINFVVTKDEHKPPYQWKSDYSLVAPMNDADNRLFTPALLLDEVFKGEKGPIAYGNELLGTNKKPAKIVAGMTAKSDTRWEFSCKDEKGTRVLDGWVDTKVSPLDMPVLTIELARVLGAYESVKEYRQRMANEELTGGLIAVQTKDKARRIREINATYKFSPSLGRFRKGHNGEYHLGSEDSEFAGILRNMNFEPRVFAHAPHIRTVLSLNEWPVAT